VKVDSCIGLEGEEVFKKDILEIKGPVGDDWI
jgi:hypothetical protein